VSRPDETVGVQRRLSMLPPRQNSLISRHSVQHGRQLGEMLRSPRWIFVKTRKSPGTTGFNMMSAGVVWSPLRTSFFPLLSEEGKKNLLPRNGSTNTPAAVL